MREFGLRRVRKFVLRDLSQAQDVLEFLSGCPLYAEKWALFVKEIAVIVVRTAVLTFLRSPDSQLAAHAQDIAQKFVERFSSAGIFGVEMFLKAYGAFNHHFHSQEGMLTVPPHQPQRPSSCE